MLQISSKDIEPENQSLDLSPEISESPLELQLEAVSNIIEMGHDKKVEIYIDEYINHRLAELILNSKVRELSLLSEPYHGFINPETVIKRTMLLDGVKIDDIDIYKLLIETIIEYKIHPNHKTKSLREIAMLAVNLTLGKYFGNYYGSEAGNENNKAFYWDHSAVDSDDFSVADFKGQGFAVCAEKAPTAQNLLIFLGYESDLIFSTECKLNSFDQSDKDGHVFCIVSTDKGRFIYDPTNPVLVINEEGVIQGTFPASYKIEEQQYKDLLSGIGIEIEHIDFGKNKDKFIRRSSKRYYGGPIQNN